MPTAQASGQLVKYRHFTNNTGCLSEAKENYEKYLSLQPYGVYAAGARAALQRFSNATAN